MGEMRLTGLAVVIVLNARVRRGRPARYGAMPIMLLAAC
jgi:hypothetical protein